MKEYKHIYIPVLLILLFIMNQIMERMGVYIYPLYGYLDDLLVVPISLSIYSWLQRFVFKRSNYTVPISLVLICILGFCFHFEILMPSISEKYTADIIDAFMYFIGGIFYQFGLNRPLQKKVLSRQT